MRRICAPPAHAAGSPRTVGTVGQLDQRRGKLPSLGTQGVIVAVSANLILVVPTVTATSPR
jgi:hypothetical protein